MKDPGQLLDSHDEPIEHIEKKWLVPLVLCMIAFAYINSILEYIVPSSKQFDRNTYANFITDGGYLFGGILYTVTGRKKLTILIGFVLLMVFCSVAVWFISSDMNISWLDSCLYGLGSGLVFYPLLSRFLQNSFPNGSKQTLFVLLILFQIIFSNLLQQSKFIQPENIGFFPLGICFVLFLFNFLFLLFNKTPGENLFTLPLSGAIPKKFPVTMLIWYLLYIVFFTLQGLVNGIHFDNIRLRNTEISDYFHLGSFAIIALITTYLLFSKIKTTYYLLFKSGLITLFISLMASTILMLNKKEHFFHDYFVLIVDELLYLGSMSVLLGMLTFMTQQYQHKNFVVLITIPAFFSSALMFLLISVRSEDTFDFFSKWSSLFSTLTLLLIFSFYLYLRQKNKPVSHERID